MVIQAAGNRAYSAAKHHQPHGKGAMRERDPARGRVVLLTGAAGGIGRVMTDVLLADGHQVAAVDRNAEGLSRLAAGADADRFCSIVADLSSADGCREAVAAAG